MIGQYKIDEVIGQGACGQVYKAYSVETGRLVAIKQVSLTFIKEDRKGSI